MLRGNQGPEIKPPLIERNVATKQTMGLRWIKEKLGMPANADVRIRYQDSQGDDVEAELDDRSVELVFTYTEPVT